MISFRPTANRRFNELMGVLLLVAATLVVLALVSYHPADPSPDTAGFLTRPANWVGPAGAWLADLLFQGFGIAAFLLAAGLAGWARRWFLGRPAAARRQSPVQAWAAPSGLLLTMIATGAVLAEIPWHFNWRSAVPCQGMAGTLLANALIALFNPLGAGILTLAALIVGIFLCTRFSFTAARDWMVLRLGPYAGPALRPLLAPYRALVAWRQRRQALV
ncbi:MAG: DNA translocase FtsK 4TM domain-containing protein, partial [Terriglobales bacterium]